MLILFLDWKNQYCENDCTTQSNLRFSEIPIKLAMAFFFHRTRKKITIHIKIQIP